MGATVRHRSIEADQPSNIEQLFKWITQVRTKKIKFLRNRRRNIRVEAVLGHALSHAEQELRNKQIERINELQKLRRRMAEIKKSYKTTMEATVQDCCQRNDATDFNSNNNGGPWSEALPELSSLDSFMSQVNEIKEPVAR